MKKTFTICCAALLAAQFMACSKKNSGSSPTLPTSGLTAMEKSLIGKWNLQSGTDTHTDGSGANKTTDMLNACQKDDVYTFNDSLHYSVSDGANICTPSSGYNYTWGWTIYDDSTLNGFVSLTPALLNQYPKIIQLDNTTLKLEYQNNIPAITGYPNTWSSDVYVFTFQRQ